jgi:hypothetical protein
MSKKANVVKLKSATISESKEDRLRLESGREIVARSDREEDLIQIVEPKGEITLKIRMTDAGPIITAEGAHLSIKATETVTLDAKKIRIHAEEEAVLKSGGGLQLDSADKTDIRSDGDIRVEGKMIHLN